MLNLLKEKIRKIYADIDQSKPKERERALDSTVRTFRVNGRSQIDYKTFITKTKTNIINLVNEQPKPIKLRLVFTCMFSKIGMDGKKIRSKGHFSSTNTVITQVTNLSELYGEGTEKMIELIDSFQNEGSGWIFEEVLYFDIFFNDYKPLKGSSYIPLPRFLALKKAIVHSKNKDQECFKWCVIESVYPQKRDCERITKMSRKNSDKFDWTGIDFPTTLKQTDHFEKHNLEYAVNVLGYDQDDGVYPLRITTKHTGVTLFNLLLIANEEGNKHYCVIKNMSGLLASQTSKHGKKSFFCFRCFNSFHSQESLDNH